MPQMRLGMLAAYLGAAHPEALIFLLDNITLLQRTRKARPARAGIIFVRGAKKRFAGNDVYVNAFLLIIPIGIVKGLFSRGVAGHLVLQCRQFSLELFGGGNIAQRPRIFLAGIVGPGFLQERLASRAILILIIMLRVCFLVILVIAFRGVEVAGRQNFGDNLFFEPAGIGQRFFRFFRQLLLLRVMIENGRAVLRPAIGELPIGVGRGDLPPEDVQEVGVRNLRRVVSDLHRLAVSGLSRGDFLITWIRFLAARVAGNNVNHAT